MGGDEAVRFEELLDGNRCSVERYVRYRLRTKADADDVLQDIYLAAYEKFGQLKNEEAFRSWIISIARNKCNDFFRRQAARLEIPLDALAEKELSCGRQGIAEISVVRETLGLLGDRDRQILYLYFWKEMPQAEIAKVLHIPLGTVKSRLHTARRNFKDRFPYQMNPLKGEKSMKKLPEFLPEYTIEESDKPPFSVKCEELMGWFLVPRLGEKLSWGMYDIPSRKRSHVYEMKVVGRAAVHGIEGVELTAAEAAYSDREEATERTFVAQLTDTHCRYLAAVRNDGNVRNYLTFLDGDAFMPVWGFGEDNCGNEIHISPRGNIRREGKTVTSSGGEYLQDIVGRYTVTLNGRRFDTVCVMVIASCNCGVVSEQFLDRDGKTVLWRRFNRDDWAIDHYGEKWSVLLPENERLTVDGMTYVQWYDCITDYVL